MTGAAPAPGTRERTVLVALRYPPSLIPEPVASVPGYDRRQSGAVNSDITVREDHSSRIKTERRTLSVPKACG